MGVKLRPLPGENRAGLRRAPPPAARPRTFAPMSTPSDGARNGGDAAPQRDESPRPVPPQPGFHSTIRLDVALDEGRIPERLRWTSSDGRHAEGGETRAFLLSIWDPERREALRIDLWNKDMQRDEMDLLVFQTLLTLSDSYAKANGDGPAAQAIKEFGFAFGEMTKLIERQPDPASGEGTLDLAALAARRGGGTPPPDLPAPGTAGAPDAPPPRRQDDPA